MNRSAQDSSATFQSTPTVLVVEDEPAVREVVADLLQDEGYAVRQASDGLQAIDQLEVDNVDLVLSDVRMPRLDGPSLARRLPGRGRAVPVVPMSAVDVEVMISLECASCPNPSIATTCSTLLARPWGRTGKRAATTRCYQSVASFRMMTPA